MLICGSASGSGTGAAMVIARMEKIERRMGNVFMLNVLLELMKPMNGM